MSIDVIADQETFERLQKEGFDSALGFWFWNIAILVAPMDTGNLRSAIVLKRNKPRNIKISYDTFRANYLQFLEEGQGPVKKYKDFIKKDTAEAIAEQFVSWVITGKAPAYASQGIRPFIVLKDSSMIFSKEKSFLRQANMNTNVITAKTRQQISKIREVSYNGSKSKSSGQKVTTLVNSRKYNRGISVLQNIYKERVNQIKS